MKPKYLIVEERIKQAIKDKEITDKLPGERTLAKEFGFSYMTIRKAIDNLVSQGVLYKVPTRGAFVTSRKSGKKKTNIIGYFLDNNIIAGLTSPYYSLIFDALEKQAARHGYSLLYFTDFDGINSLKHINRIDGVIASCFPRIENIIHDIKSHVPTVVIDNSSSDKTIPSVIIDNFNAVKDSVDYLCKLGHERIGFMTGLEDSDVGKNRTAGYKSGLASNNIKFNERLVFKGNFSYESGLAGADYFLSMKNPPTAIMCANDSMAISALGKIIQEGLAVPDDISIIGFDDIAVASQIHPPLTTISAPIEKIAEYAVNMLITLIQHAEVDNMHVALPAKLVKRSTCAEVKVSTAAA
jgi:DNA-binding LacI/PurR family transcriptional regulator